MSQEDRVTVRPPAKKFLERVDEAISALDSSASPDTVSRVVMACLLLGGTDDVRIGRMLGVPAEERRRPVYASATTELTRGSMIPEDEDSGTAGTSPRFILGRLIRPLQPARTANLWRSPRCL